jgi:hypothetical protein
MEDVGISYGHLVYFKASWYFFVTIWYIFYRLVMLYQ